MSSDNKPERASSPLDATMRMPTGGQVPSATAYPSASGGGGWVPPTLEALQRMLPNYEFVEMLGAGGMGAVYKARQTSLDRLVAIKILPPGLDDGSGANFTERFKQEARTMAKMSHPCIVNVHDFGQTSEGQFYFVMEFIEGTDVQKMIRANKRLKPEDALSITAHVCDALEYAHQRGIIHRDIKPANVLISAEGTVKIADFGLAKAVDNKSHELTRSNIAMGTPHFMAPETMFADVKVDARADLYAVGVMLHNMLTGEIPTGMFKLPSKKVGCDARFDEIVKRAMEADREERYQTATEIRKDLDTILTTPVSAEGADSIPVVPVNELKNVQKMKAVTDSVVADVKKKESAKAPPSEKPKAGSVSRLQPESEEPPKGGTPNKVPAKKPDASPSLGKIMAITSAVAIALIGLFAWSPWKRSGDIPVAAATNVSATGTSPLPVKSGQVARVTTPQPVAEPPPPAPVKLSPSSEPWVDGLAEWLSVPGNATKGTMTQEGSAWRFNGPEAVTLAANQTRNVFSNVAVRLTFRYAAKKGVGQINLRAGKTGDRYEATVHPNGVAVITRSMGKAMTELFKTNSASGYDPALPHVMEFRAEGDVLSLFVDGQECGSVKDASLAAGGLSVQYGLIEKIEYRELPATTMPGTALSPVKFSPSTESWVNALADPELLMLGNGTTRTPDGLLVLADRTTLTQLKGPDYAVRMIVAPKAANQRPKIQLRGGLGKTNYMVLVGNDHVRVVRSPTTEGTRFPIGRSLKPTDTYELEARIVGSKITVTFDGVVIGSMEDTSLRAGDVSIGSEFPDGVLLRAVQYLDLSATAAKLTPSAEPWVDVLASPAMMELKGDATLTSNGLQVGKGTAKFAQINRPDYAVRMIVEHVGNLGPKLVFREQNYTSYVFRVISVPPLQVNVTRGFFNRTEQLANFPFTRKLQPGDTYELEARFVGNKITVAFDGVVIGTVEDTHTAAGGVTLGNFDLNNVQPYRAVQYLDLSKPARPAIPADATAFNGHRYQLVKEGDLSWPEAKARAEKMGGYLATLTSAEENQMATDLAKDVLLATNENHNGVWIGLSEKAEGDGWKWVTSEPLAFSQWLAGEPSGGRGRKIGWPLYASIWHQLSKPEIGWNSSVSSNPSGTRQNRGFLVEWDDDGGAKSERGAIKLWSTKESVTENDQVRWVDGERAVRISGAIRLAAPVPPSRDGVLRASIKVEGGRGVAHIRLRTDGAPDKGFCSLVINSEARKFDLAAREEGVTTNDEFKRIPFPTGLDAMTWNQYELRIVGDEWTVFVNGQKLDSVRNSTRSAAGRPMIVSIGDTLFRDVVFTPLDSSAAVPKQTFDLLALTDPVRDRGASPSLIGANTWEKSGGVLTYMSDGKAGKIAAPVSLNARDYEIEVAFRRATADDRFHLDLPLSSNRVIPVIFGSSRTNVIVPGDVVIGSSPAFATTLTGRVALRVRPAGGDASSITITLDGAPAGFWTGKLDSIGWKIGGKNPAFPGEPVTSLYCASTDYSFTSWTLRVFDGEARLLRPSTTATESRATTGGWISLMEQIDPAKDAVTGTWSRVADGVQCAKNGKCVLQLSYEPPEEYDFRITFTTASGSFEAMQFLTARGHDFRWVSGAYNGLKSGFDCVGGVAIANSPAAVKAEHPFVYNERRECVVEVRRDRVTGFENGRKIVEWKTDYSNMSRDKFYPMRDAHHIGLGTYDSKTTFHDISVREVTGKGKLLR